MRDLLRFWFTFEQPVSRRAYLLHGLSLIVIKYWIDALLIWLATGTIWTPLSYLSNVPMLIVDLREARPWLLPTLTIWSLPFVWIGVTLTARRAYDAGWSYWSALAFFVPFGNYVLMFILCLMPSARPQTEQRPAAPVEARPASRLLASTVAGAATGLAMTTLEFYILREYALALFVGTPFTMGAVTAFVYNLGAPATFGRTLQVTVLMLVLSTALVFVFAFEGAICIVMAAPLIFVVALLGALIGRKIATRSDDDLRPAFYVVLLLPLASVLEPSGSSGRMLHEVQSAVEISAPPDLVWPHVVEFSPITSAPELPFRLGIAEPLSARIEGSGVGAVRYCTFSTGSFVEPITSWQPGRRLAFDVTSSPDPLRELSPYANVAPPHLHGYLRSQRGEFRLIPLAGGRTRLEGSTWYELQMAPEGYWQVFTDYLIHAIHRRVLTHIKQEVEGQRS